MCECGHRSSESASNLQLLIAISKSRVCDILTASQGRWRLPLKKEGKKRAAYSQAAVVLDIALPAEAVHEKANS